MATTLLEDDFSGDLSKWPGKSGTVVIEDGRAKLTTSTAGGSDLETGPGVKYNMDLGGDLVAQFTPRPAPSESYMKLMKDTGNCLMFHFNNGNVLARTVVGSNYKTEITLPQPTADTWYKLSITNDPEGIFSTSPDGVTWTEIARSSIAVTFARTALYPSFSLSTDTSGHAVKDAFVDNVLLTKTDPAPLNDWWIWDGTAEIPAVASLWDGATETEASIEVTV